MDLTETLQRHLVDYGTPLFLFGLLLLLAAEWRFPRFALTPRQRLLGIARNLMIWVACLASLFLLTWLAPFAHHLVIQHDVGLFPQLGLPWWVAACAGFIVADLADYVFHRLSHRWQPLWLLHAVHHSDPHMGVTTNLRAHPLSVLAGFLFRVLVILAIGAPLWVLLLRDTLATTLAQLHHAGIAWPRGFVEWSERRLGWLFMVPTAHWVHHLPEQRYTDSNFGQIFSLWDRIFGTYVPMTDMPPLAGLDALREPHWQTTWGMLATPWRARKLQRL